MGESWWSYNRNSNLSDGDRTRVRLLVMPNSPARCKAGPVIETTWPVAHDSLDAIPALQPLTTVPHQMRQCHPSIARNMVLSLMRQKSRIFIERWDCCGQAGKEEQEEVEEDDSLRLNVFSGQCSVILTNDYGASVWIVRSPSFNLCIYNDNTDEITYVLHSRSLLLWFTMSDE
jgi:hypothetical protein